VLDIPYQWLESKFIVIEKNAFITCTLIGSMIINDKNKEKISLEVYLRAIFWRRIMECYERKLWYVYIYRYIYSYIFMYIMHVYIHINVYIYDHKLLYIYVYICPVFIANTCIFMDMYRFWL
jgi:hypothetical protein